MGLKVFLSYGHDANAALVQRIRADLDAAGHRTWIDTAKIKFANDWRREIHAGITASDCALAFLSKHTICDPGVCLDAIVSGMHDGPPCCSQISPQCPRRGIDIFPRGLWCSPWTKVQQPTVER